MADDRFRDFPAFAPAFEPGPLEVGAYLVLLNLSHDTSEAVLIVSLCLERAHNKRQQIANLFSGSLGGWRSQLVGCVATLASMTDDRPDDALLNATCRSSWVSPQLLATMSLVDPSDWLPQVEQAILDRGDPKAAAAFLALNGNESEALAALAPLDRDSGDEIALGWRERITVAFDRADLTRSW
jgi:hypothetical protein